jgi:hypothetical protein
MKFELEKILEMSKKMMTSNEFRRELVIKLNTEFRSALVEVRKISDKWYERIIINPVRTAIVVFILATLAVLVLTAISRLYRPEFFEGVLIEAHGMLFDILVIGAFILWLNEKGEKLRTIQRLQEEIEDFRGWEHGEAAHRIRGNIKRLNEKGVTNIKLMSCYLKSMRLEEVKLQGANLQEANLQEAYLFQAKFQGAFLLDANLQGADLRFADLSRVTLDYANLREAHLGGTILKGSDLFQSNLRKAELGADFRGANLQGADLRGARYHDANFQDTDFRQADLRGVLNLNIEALSEAKTLYEAQLDPEVREQIEEKCPRLLKKTTT